MITAKESELAKVKDIIVVYHVKRTALSICSLLNNAGLHVSDICALGATALSLVHDKIQCIIICPSMMQDMTAAELANNIPQGIDVIALSNNGSLQYMDNLVTLPVPIDPEQFLQTVRIFASSSQSNFIRRSKNDDEYIQKAKECLMSSMNMTEDEAHKYLQKTSMQTRQSMLETAKKIIESLV